MPDSINELLANSKWVWVDYTIAGIIFISALTGLLRGFIKEAFALITWAVAFWIGVNYSHDVSIYLQQSVALPSARLALAFAVLFFTSLILGGMLSYLLTQLVQKTGLTGSDRLLGMGFGLFRGAFLVSLLIMLAGFTPLPEDPWWKQSQLIPPFKNLALWLKDRIPSNMADYIKYR
ncbi:CvpA family protein [Methylomonas paludis]|uniref:CvpA family protein n=1 Tax=Methylomonas paludis TaxID=1173101 RepID=A0A975R8K6_9GAMM|nr:CvpA family protein [Methylomonas paludis]QWF70112.1 CvpA family protein [Methylomonas paludis]